MLSRSAQHLPATNGGADIIFYIFIYAALALALTVGLGIIGVLISESWRFFSLVPPTNFFFGAVWNPQIGAGDEWLHRFGVLPVLAGTVLITALAMALTLPLALLVAVYLNFYAPPDFRRWFKPLLELLAAIPTVVYGFVAIIIVSPALQALGRSLGLTLASEMALSAGLVMSLMLLPLLSSLCDDALRTIPRAWRDGCLGLGALPNEAIRKIYLPCLQPALLAAVLITVGRALGETMIVVMAAGMAARLTFNPLEPVTTATVQIVTLLIGDQAFDSPKTLAAYALGLTLFTLSLGLNMAAQKLHHRVPR